MARREEGSMNPEKDRRRKKFEHDQKHEKGSRAKIKNPRRNWED